MPTLEPQRGNVIFNSGERWIQLSGWVDRNTAKQFVRFLVETQGMNCDWSKPISVIINNSRGGDAVAAHLIYRMLADFLSPVATYAVNRVVSAALTIFQAGSKRYMAADAQLKFHWGAFRFLKDDLCDIEDLNLMRERIRRINSHLFRIYAKRTGLEMKTIKKFFREEKILTAKEAKKYNLVDEIAEKPVKHSCRHKKIARKKRANKRRNGK